VAGDDFDLSAAGLRADSGDIATTVEVIARKLEDALPAHTSVQRRGRPLSRAKHVYAIEVRLGDWRYQLQFDGRAIAASREREVGGIAIKRESLSLVDWVGAMTAELRASAEQSAQARTALERLLD
jgi:hypothetical protein